MFRLDKIPALPETGGVERDGLWFDLIIGEIYGFGSQSTQGDSIHDVESSRRKKFVRIRTNLANSRQNFPFLIYI